MNLKNLSNDLQELTPFECNEVNGGESIWYWAAYGAGALARGCSDFVNSHRETTSNWNLAGVR